MGLISLVSLCLGTKSYTACGPGSENGHFTYSEAVTPVWLQSVIDVGLGPTSATLLTV